MAEAGTAYIEFRGDFTAAARQLRTFAASATSVGASAGGRFGSAFTSSLRTSMAGAARQITDLAKTAGVALAGLGVAGGGFGLKLAAEAETAQVAFEGLLGSASEAQAFIAELREFAKVTPFELPGLQVAARQLLAVGFAAEDVIPTLTTIGDVAASLGVGEEQIQGVIRALGQMQGKGKITAEELQQISEQIPGFSAIGAIAEGMGITVAEAFDLISKGAIPADEGIQAILAGMKEAPGAMGAMERQALTLSGMLSTLKDTIGLEFQEAFAPIADVVKFVLPGLTDAIGKALGTIGPEMTAAGTAIAQTLIPAITTLTPLFSDLLVAVGGIASVLVPIFEAMKPVIAAFGDVFLTVIYAVLSAIQPLIPLLADVGVQIAGSLLTAVQALAPVLPVLATAFGQIATVLAGTLAAVLPNVAEAFAVLAPIIAEIAPLLAGALGGAVAGLSDLLPGLATVLGEVAQLITAGLIAVLPTLIDAFTQFAPHIGTIVSLLGGAFMGVLRALLPVLPQIADTIGILAEAFAGTLAVALPAIAEAFAELVPHIGPVVEALAGGLLGVFEELAPLLPVLADTLGTVAEALAGGLGAALTALAPLFPVILQAVQALAPVIATVASALGPVLTPIIEGLAEGLVPLVEMLGEGLLDAVEQMAPLLPGLAAAFGELLAVIGPAAVDVISTLVDSLMQDPQTIVDLASAIVELATVLIPLIPLALDLITPLLRLYALWNTALITAVTHFAEVLATVLRPIIEALVWYVDHVVVPIWGLWADAAEAAFGLIVDGLEALWHLVEPIFDALGDKVELVRTWFEENFGGIVAFLGNIPAYIEAVFQSLADTITAPFTTAFQIIKDAWNNTIGGFGFEAPDWLKYTGPIGAAIAGQEFTIPKMHTGGIVPGLPGEEVLTLLEAGERVTPANQAGAGGVHFHTQAATWKGGMAADVYWDLSRFGWAA